MERGAGKERAIAFSDGVFAIAITLLVLNIGIPSLPDESAAELDRALDRTLPNLLSYFIGFYVIGKFWLGHHRLFGGLRAVDDGMLNANLAYLALIAVLPFPTGVLGEHPGLTAGVVVFAAAVSLAGLAETSLLLLAHRKDLLGAEWRGRRRADLFEALSTPVVFGLSIPLAFLSPAAGMYSWLTLIVVRRGGARLGLMPA